MPTTLVTFDRAGEANWIVVNDGVMGGRSAGRVAVTGCTLRFRGTLVTQGGGFTLTRARRRVDLTGTTALELRVRGSGRRFEVELDDGTRGWGHPVSRRAAFPTTAGWAVMRVPNVPARRRGVGVRFREAGAPPPVLARRPARTVSG